MHPYAFRVRGNAKSAGTHDAPIPGLVTSRRVHKVVKVPQEPVITKKQRAQMAAEERRKQERREQKEKDRREREKERQERGTEERSGSPSKRDERSDSSSSHSLDRREKRREEERQRRRDEEEERQRRKAEEQWKAQQAEREARQARDAQVAAAIKQKEETRRQSRKNNLKGLFAVDDDLDEVDGSSAANQVMKKAVVPLPGPHEVRSTSSKQIVSIDNKDEDATQFRASLADPSSAGQHSAGDVASQYKILMEMKRKYRGRDFGGPAEESKYKNKFPSRSRSRSRRRGRR